MSYAPDESAALLDRERGLYDGFTLGAAAYGANTKILSGL